MSLSKKDCIIIEGGGFRTAFTSGILDSFISSGYNPFRLFYGISGGSVALSFYMSGQYRQSKEALSYLVTHPSFTNYKRIFDREGYMDIDVLSKVAQEEFPFDAKEAMRSAQSKKVQIIVTNINTGQPEYIEPDENNWIEWVTASCTLPFVTKGVHQVDGKAYFDGGWSDALPVKKAYEEGARNILILRTWPSGEKSTQSWADYFGSIYFRNNPVLAEIFNSSFKKYNEAVDFILNPPSDLTITEIAPEQLLNSGTYIYTANSIDLDYRYGLDLGIKYLMNKLYSDLS